MSDFFEFENKAASDLVPGDWFIHDGIWKQVHTIKKMEDGKIEITFCKMPIDPYE